MNYYRAIPIGKRPTADEQAAALAQHRQVFKAGAPSGLAEALTEHGLELPEEKAVAFAKRVAMWTFIGSVVGLILYSVGLKGRD
jgi:hypothetical protein